MTKKKIVDISNTPKRKALDADREKLTQLYVDLFAFDDVTFQGNTDIFRNTANALYDLQSRLIDLKNREDKDGLIYDDSMKTKLLLMRAKANSLHVKVLKKGFFENEKNYLEVYSLAEEVKNIALRLISMITIFHYFT